MKVRGVAFLISLLVGCDLHDVVDTQQGCSDPSLLSITELKGVPATVTQDVTLRGTLSRPSDVTLEALLFGGVASTSVADNFASFSVTLPLATIQSYATATVPPSVLDAAAIPVTAVTNCADQELELTPVSLSVGPRRTEGLAISLPQGRSASDLSAGETLLPITISSSAASAGAKVTLTTTGGTFSGQSAIDVTLIKAGSAAEATAYLAPGGKQQTVVVAARSPSEVATIELRFVAGPVLQPAEAPLYVSVPLTVHVDSFGSSLARCRALAPPNVTVLSGTKDLTDDTMNVLSAPSVTVTMTASAGALDESVVTLQCYDVHGQFVTGLYTVAL